MDTPRLKILFLCAMNLQRSPTAERLYRNDPRLEVRSAGPRVGARRLVNADDLAWADVVFVMEREHKTRLKDDFPDIRLPRIAILDIPDDYGFMQPELVEILKLTIDAELRELLPS